MSTKTAAEILTSNFPLSYIHYSDWVCTAVMSNDVMKASHYNVVLPLVA